MKTSAGPKPTTTSKSTTSANPAAPMASLKSPAPASGLAKAPTPGATQPAGSRFRAPEAPSMAPRGTPSTPSRRLDKTP